MPNSKRLFTLSAILITFATLFSFDSYAQSPAADTMPKLLTQREQMKVREGWLRKRLGTLLPGMMKRHGIDMWIVVNEEFNSDPVTPHITPPIPIVGRRDVFIFIDRGETHERIAMVRYDEERLKNHYRMVMPARDKFGEELKKIVDERKPKTIALNIGGSRGQQSGLSYDSYRFLAESLGAEHEEKFVSAADLLVEFFDTRLPEELEHYRNAVAATEIIARRAFSNEVITPGKTTVGDVRWWMMEEVNKLGLTIWFQPDLRIQRRRAATETTGPFLSTAAESEVIRRGDLLHLDFGLDYMGLSTDWPKHAYVLNEANAMPGRTQGALRNTNKLAGHHLLDRPDGYNISTRSMSVQWPSASGDRRNA